MDKYSVMGLLDHMVDLERFLELGYRELRAFHVVLVVKNSPANAGEKGWGFDPWIRKIPWRRT